MLLCAIVCVRLEYQSAAVRRNSLASTARPPVQTRAADMTQTRLARGASFQQHS
jgi:hypothetical protein